LNDLRIEISSSVNIILAFLKAYSEILIQGPCTELPKFITTGVNSQFFFILMRLALFLFVKKSLKLLTVIK